jgi:protein-L-isoaspartate(D-aspartate) O-methyltransferase
MKTIDFTYLRQMMVEHQLRGRDIRNERVLAVMGELPRDRFVPPEYRDMAYDDCALPIGWEQTISQPYMVAIMTQTLGVEAHHRVLEIGTGSGYQAAVLGKMAREVFTVERIPELGKHAEGILEKMGFANISFKIDDGTLGWPEKAPFDRIVVTAGAPWPPQNLIDQLSADGGVLIIPVGSEDEQILLRIIKTGNAITRESLLACRFVKLLGEQGWRIERE